MSPLRSRIPHLARAIFEKRHNSPTCGLTGSQPLSWHRHTDGQPAHPHRSNVRYASVRSTSPVGRLKPPTSYRKPSRPRTNLPKSLPSEAPGPEDDEIKIGSPRSLPYDQRRGRTYMIACCVFGTAFGGYLVYLYLGFQRQIAEHAKSGRSLTQNADVSDRWKDLTRNFDEEVENAEWAMGMGKRRKQLAKVAYGNVLEVSAGTGRNMRYYDLRPFDPLQPRRRNYITSLTFNDQSNVMIAAAEKKFDQLSAGSGYKGTAKFVVGDASIRGVIDRPPGGYDTIIQSMGLCSIADPVAFLRTMGRLCRQPGEASKNTTMAESADDGKGGRIVLLEHGRSTKGFVNRILDAGASLHADRYGCWWNKDIQTIVEQSGLEIEDIRRYNFGTTWEIHMRPRPDVVKRSSHG